MSIRTYGLIATKSRRLCQRMRSILSRWWQRSADASPNWMVPFRSGVDRDGHSFRIDDVSQDLVVAFVPAWNPNEAVRFPRSIIPDHFRSTLKPDDRFFASVNTDAEKADDLFFGNFEAAAAVGSEHDIFSSSRDPGCRSWQLCRGTGPKRDHC